MVFLVRRESISQSDWIDYIFSDGIKITKNLLNNSVYFRRKAYVWYISHRNSEDILDKTKLEWYKRIQLLKFFVNSIQYRKRLRNSSETYLNQQDLLGDSFDDIEEPICSFQLNSNGKIRYTLTDIIGILKMNLEKRQEFESTAQNPIDPYTREKWNIGTLFYVQGWLRKQNIKPSKIPLSVFMWLSSPYVYFTIKNKTSEMTLISKYLEMKSHYDYLKDSQNKEVFIDYIFQVCKILEINTDLIHWNRLSQIKNEQWQNICKPIIFSWSNPMNQWEYIDEFGEEDFRIIKWQRILKDCFRQLECWFPDIRFPCRRRKRRCFRIGRRYNN